MSWFHLLLRPRIGLALWCLGWLVICGLLLMPIQVGAPSGSDLVVHFLLFAGMAFGAVTFCRRPLTLLLLALLTTLTGGALEMAQALVPYRSFSASDFVADALGAAAGFGIALIVLQVVIRPASPRLADARSGG